MAAVGRNLVKVRPNHSADWGGRERCYGLGQASCGGWAAPLRKGARGPVHMWGSEEDRSNHSEAQGSWQNETTRKGQL